MTPNNYIPNLALIEACLHYLLEKKRTITAEGYLLMFDFSQIASRKWDSNHDSACQTN